MDSCKENAKPDEPTFTIRGQDMTADLVVEIWVALNIHLRRAVAHGDNPYQAIANARAHLNDILCLNANAAGIPKLEEALQIAARLRAYKPQKVAD